MPRLHDPFLVSAFLAPMIPHGFLSAVAAITGGGQVVDKSPAQAMVSDLLAAAWRCQPGDWSAVCSLLGLGGLLACCCGAGGELPENFLDELACRLDLPSLRNPWR